MVGTDAKSVIPRIFHAIAIRSTIVSNGLERKLGQALLNLGSLHFQDRTFGPGAFACCLGSQRAKFSEFQSGQVDFELADLARKILRLKQWLTINQLF